MGAIIELLLFTFLCVSVGKVHAECRHVNNDDMIEYSCVGGQLSDLDVLPASTGKIRITNMQIPRITKNTFARFGSDLWVLGCSYCGIREIEPGSFEHLQNLQQLSLDNNQLSTIKESWFKGLGYLTYLDLNYNNLESIDDGVFEALPSLIDLRLSGNRLECLNLEDMTNLKELKRIFLTENSEFKCPNAVSAYLENKGVNFERDPTWDRIPEDLIPVEVPEEDDYYDSTPLPPYRERLHLTTPRAPVESTPEYVPPKFQTTEEVVYRPVYNPDWRRPTTPLPPPAETPPEPIDLKQYVPPMTISPLDPAIEYEMTLRPWSRLPESTSAKPEFPSHENENTRGQTSYSSESDPSRLAAGPTGHETVSFTESDMERNTRDPIWDDYTVFETKPPEQNRPMNVARPYPTPPEMIQPASPDNSYQAPYYEHPVTVHPPPTFDIEQPVMPPTTDKPLPECPTSSASTFDPVHVLALLVILVGTVFVEGF